MVCFLGNRNTSNSHIWLEINASTVGCGLYGRPKDPVCRAIG